MGVRSALGTMGRFIAAVWGIYFAIVPGSVLLLLAVRVAGGNYAAPDGTLSQLSDLDFLVALLLGAWFVVESHSLKRLFAFGVAVWVLFVVGLGAASVVGSSFLPFSFGSVVFGTLLLVACTFGYLGAYRLVYPASFAERKEKFVFET